MAIFLRILKQALCESKSLLQRNIANTTTIYEFMISVMNGGQPGGGVNLSSGGVVGLPGHDHGRGVGLPGHGVGVGGSSVEGGMLNPAALGLHHQSMFGMPGVIQALPISQGIIQFWIKCIWR